jgi:hypothetical protein
LRGRHLADGVECLAYLEHVIAGQRDNLSDGVLRESLSDHADEPANRERLYPGFRSLWSNDHPNLGSEQERLTDVEGWSCVHALDRVGDRDQAGSKAATRGGGWMDSAW